MLRIPRIAGTITIRLSLGFVVAGFVFVGCFLAATPAALAATPSFQVKVPHKNAPLVEVFTLKLTVSVTSATGPVTFTVTPPGGAAVATPALSPGSAPTSNILVNGDVMKVFSPPGGLGDTNPLKRKYLIVINLITNVNFTTCASSSPAGPDETWTIAVSGADFDGACVQTLDKNAGGGACDDTFRTVPPNDAATPSTSIATILGADGGPSELGCRPGVDAVLVLDRSGSMDSPVLGGPDPTLPKLTALKTAVTNFMTVWKNLRTNEANTMQSGNPSIVSPIDRVGVAFFDSSVPAKWLKQLDATSTTVNGMNDVTNAIADDISLKTAGITTGGATSIGSGLFLTDGVLTPLASNGNRKVFLVMSDGMENTDRRTRVNPMDSTDVQTTQGAVATSLVNQPPAQIYALTIGSPGAINPTINQAIADASQGFYLNSEYDTAILSNFFLEVLQNFIKFSTVETYRMVSSKASLSAPYTTSMPVTSTTTSLTFSLSWNARSGSLKLTVTPPDGSPPIVRSVAGGSMVLNVPLQSGIKAGGGNWGIRVEPDITITSLKLPQQVPAVPFNLIVLGDDTGVNADLTTISADYAPGDQIRLSARVTEIGEALTGLNTQAGATVVAELIRPDAGGIGDLLSSSNASSSPPTSPDPLSPVDAKLQNTLAANNDAIQRASSTIVLLDNGNAANGDARAGDGVYSALFPAQIIGHYNFLFGIEGTTTNVGRFSRQQLRTVHVRAVPDSQNTTVTTSVQGSGTRNVLVINMTPKTKFGHRLGPGWGNYFWVTGNGMSPMKFNDNMNGTYTASVPFSGNPPSDVKIHFERVNEYISDTTTAGQLPIPLGNGTVVIPNVPVQGGFRRWGVSLHAGVSIPHGDLNTFVNPGPNFGVDLEYRFNQMFSAEAIYTYHRFNGDNFGFGSFFDLNVHQLSINGKVYGSSSPIRPFFNFGGGAYVITPGVSTHGGLNVGGGVQFDVTPNIAIDAMYNFHNVFTSGSDTRFSAVQGGVRFRF